MAECKWTRELCKELRTFNALAVTYPQGRTSHPGWPDRILVHSRIGAVFVEFKDIDTPISAKQVQCLLEIQRRAPGTAFVCRRMSESKAMLSLPDDSGEVSFSLRERKGAGELLNALSELQRHDHENARTDQR